MTSLIGMSSDILVGSSCFGRSSSRSEYTSSSRSRSSRSIFPARNCSLNSVSARKCNRSASGSTVKGVPSVAAWEKWIRFESRMRQYFQTS
eukprot:scaffold33979_cov96-Attheya_sp.AAC.5